MATADRPDQVPAGVFEALHQIGVAIGGVLKPLGLARLVAEHARALLAADAVGLWIYDEQNDCLKALYLENAPSASPMPDSRPGEGLIGRAFSQRAPVVVSDYTSWEHALPVARPYADPPAVVAVPLLVGGRAIGVLGVGFPEPQQATPSAVRTLTLLAAEVGPALEAARLYEAMRVELPDRRRVEDSLPFQPPPPYPLYHTLLPTHPH